MTTKKRNIRPAQENRRQIALVFGALNNGALTPSMVLSDAPACLGRMTTFDVIRRFPHLGKDGAETVLRHAKVWPLDRFGDLTPRERKAILTHLPPRAKTTGSASRPTSRDHD